MAGIAENELIDIAAQLIGRPKGHIILLNCHYFLAEIVTTSLIENLSFLFLKITLREPDKEIPSKCRIQKSRNKPARERSILDQVYFQYA